MKGALNFKSFLIVSIIATKFALAQGTDNSDLSVGATDIAPAQSPVSYFTIPALADDDAKVKFKAQVQLAGQGQSGTVLILKKIVADDGTFTWTRIDKCGSSNSFENRPTGDRAFRTPAGRFQPLDTSNRLLYTPIQDWDSHGPATYYVAIQSKTNVNQRAFAAIHNGHIPGQNSHGCVRTENDCANEVREFADSVAVDVPADANNVVPSSLIFTRLEAAAYGGLTPPVTKQNRRDFSAMVLELLDF